MGIQGLDTYIKSREEFFESHELHACRLVIDGPSLVNHLFGKSKINSAFGGDYDVWANFVKTFFDEFTKCKITPLVIFDGAMETKKMQTKNDRMNKRLQDMIRYSLANGNPSRILPTNTMFIFEHTLKRMGIKVVRCVFEDDPCIAAVAKILKCPVLSSDSDFFIFGSMYIPIRSLDPGVHVNSSKNGYAIRCKLFRPENLFASFPGLNSSILPLATVLLGNDYVDRNTFNNFHRSMTLSSEYHHLHNPEQTRIHWTLQWLKNYNLNDAVAAVLGIFPKERRREILDIIELVVNGYFDLPCDILIPLGFLDEYEEEMRARRRRKKYKFRGNIDNLEPMHFWRGEPFFASEETNEREESKEEPIYLKSLSSNKCKPNVETFAASWPIWYARDYGLANLPCYFSELMLHRLHIAAIQTEDCRYPCAEAISSRIIEVIHGLLVRGREESADDLLHVRREETGFACHRTTTRSGIGSTIFPTLDELRDTPMSLRIKIFNDTLEITGKNDVVARIPPKWVIYVAALSFWIKQRGEPLVNSCHFYAILFAMLMGVVDDKIGYCRTIESLKRATKKKHAYKRSDARFVECDTIIEAMENVTEEDCQQAARLLISNHSVNPKLRKFSKNFNITIVHAFSQFQSCVKHAIHLNALLGYPYEIPIIAELFNGTLLYNLYCEFEKRQNLESHIAEILQKSPSVLQLLNLLIENAKELLDAPLVDGHAKKKSRSQRKARKRALNVVEEYEKYESEWETDEELSTISDEEVIPILTAKVKKLLQPDVVNGDRGVKKRKYKKKKKMQRCDEDNATKEDKVLRRGSIVIRQFRKFNRRSWYRDTVQTNGSD